MKYIKTFENLKDEPQVGDYVIFNMNYINDDFYIRLSEFLDNNFGVIKNIRKAKYSDNYYADVKYNNIPKNLLDAFNKYHTRDFRIDKIYAYGKTPEDVKMKIQANKYNL